MSTATVCDDTIQLPPGVHLPDGAMVRIELVEERTPVSIEAWLKKARGAAGAGLTTDGDNAAHARRNVSGLLFDAIAPSEAES